MKERSGVKKKNARCEMCNMIVSVYSEHVQWNVVEIRGKEGEGEGDAGNHFQIFDFQEEFVIGSFVYFISLSAIKNVLILYLFLQTTYETFRYGRLGRPRVYDRGCLKNFQEVLCSKIKPSRNNFHAYVQENERVDSDGNRREKVEDDREIGGDLLQISQRREADDAQSNLNRRQALGS